MNSINSRRLFDIRNIFFSLSDERDEDRNSEEGRAILRLYRQRARMGYDDDEDKYSNDEAHENDNEDYIDYRTYPLNLNWFVVNSSASTAYDILKTYGYIAVYLYNKLTANVFNFKCTVESFLQKLIETYFLCCKQSEEQKNNQSETSKIMKTVFPTIKILYDLITSETIMTKEIVVIKALLDIYEHYYFTYEKYEIETIMNYLLPASLAFYSNLTIKEVDDLNGKAKTIKIPSESIQEEVKKHIKKDRSAYIKYYLNLIRRYKILYESTQKDKFIQ